MELRFKRVKETKNTVRFQEEGTAPVIGTLYLNKEAVGKMKLKEDEDVKVQVSKWQ